MKIIICVDDKYGMMFNKRRQSSDSLLRQSILETVGPGNLYMNSYSKGQFSEESDNIIVSENFLEMCEDDDFCFVENVDIAPYLERIKGFIVYHWNRAYPSDLKFNSDLLIPFKLYHSEDFRGNSHERITKEEYTRD